VRNGPSQREEDAGGKGKKREGKDNAKRQDTGLM